MKIFKIVKELHFEKKYYNILEVILKFQIGSCNLISLFSLRGNRLIYLPEEIGRLSRLKILNLTSNMLKCLPYSISKLKELQALWLAENQVGHETRIFY